MLVHFVAVFHITDLEERLRQERTRFLAVYLPAVCCLEFVYTLKVSQGCFKSDMCIFILILCSALLNLTRVSSQQSILMLCCHKVLQ